MIDKIPATVRGTIHTLQKEKFRIYLVGGCVRNMLLGREVIDWDLTTDATPEEMQHIFPDSYYNNTYGTVGIPYEEDGKKHVIEITTFRTEEGYADKRHPEVRWGTSIEED